MNKQAYQALVEKYSHEPNSRYYKIATSEEIIKYLRKNRKRGLYNCNHCEMSYHNIYELALHFDENSVERRFYCDCKGCPYTVLGFATSNECNRHLNSVHGDKSYICNDCQQAFSRVDQLNAHISRTHKNPHSRFNKKLSKQRGVRNEEKARKLRVDYLIN